MAHQPPKRKRGRPGKPRTKTEAVLAEIDSHIQQRRRRVSSKDRLFISKFAEMSFVDANAAAIAAGFVEPGIGWKLADRLRDLIDVERMRASAGQQMDLDEALGLAAQRARTEPDPKVALGNLTLVLRALGALSDKPASGEDRKDLLRQMTELTERLRQKGRKAGERVRAVLRTKGGDQLGVEISGDGDESGASDEPSDALAVRPPDPPRHQS